MGGTAGQPLTKIDSTNFNTQWSALASFKTWLALTLSDITTALGFTPAQTAHSHGTAEIDNDAVTYAKLQNVSATDKVLGRSTSGAGDVEEIACTAAGRALIDDADAAAQRTTLALGTADSPQFAKVGLGVASPTLPLEIFVSASSATAKTRTGSASFFTGTNMHNSSDVLAASFTYGNASVSPTNLRNVFFLGPRIANEALVFVNGTAATERARLAGDGTFGIGVTVPGGQIHTKSAAAGTITEVVQGAASQTADLTEWLNSASTVLAKITAAGYLGLPGGLRFLGYVSSAAAPTTTELTTDKDIAIHKDTVLGTIRLAYNNGGAIVSVVLV